MKDHQVNHHPATPMKTSTSHNAAQSGAVEASRLAPLISKALAGAKRPETATSVIASHTQAVSSQETSTQQVGRLVHSQVTAGALLASKACEADKELGSLLSSLHAFEPPLNAVMRQW